MKNSSKLLIFLLFIGFGITSCSKDSSDPSLALAVTSFSPSTAKIGESVTIVGTGFGANTQVKFGNIVATDVTFKSSTELVVKVPSGTFREKISVINGTQSVESSNNFLTSNYILDDATLVDSLKNISLVYKDNLVWFGRNYPGVTNAEEDVFFPCPPPCIPTTNTISITLTDKYFSWDNAQSACPTGWRLPSKTEYEALSDALTSSSEQEYTTLFNGAMKMTLSGYFNTSNRILDKNVLGNYWTSTSSSTNGTYIQLNRSNTTGYIQYLETAKSLRFCIRCVKDLPQ